MSSRQKIPATIVTGFLGSGKTTLMRHILANANGRRIAVIVNEFGELGIDGELLRDCGLGCEDGQPEAAGQLYELANGCLCCTVQEEFYPVMQALIARRDEIDHILIETSGLALPKPLVQAFNWPDIGNACTVDAVITMVDVPATAAGQFAANPAAVEAQRLQDPNLDHESPLHELFEDQLMSADLVVLSKADQASEAELAAVSALVRAEVPPQVKLVPADHGQLDLDVVLGLGQAAEAGIHLRESHHDHEHGPGDEHDHDHDAFSSFDVSLPAVPREPLIAALQALVAQHDVLRIKGFVAVPDKPMRLVVQGVGKRFDSHFDRHWAEGEARGTRLVIIGQQLDQAAITASLQAQFTTAHTAGAH